MRPDLLIKMGCEDTLDVDVSKQAAVRFLGQIPAWLLALLGVFLMAPYSFNHWLCTAIGCCELGSRPTQRLCQRTTQGIYQHGYRRHAGAPSPLPWSQRCSQYCTHNLWIYSSLPTHTQPRS